MKQLQEIRGTHTLKQPVCQILKTSYYYQFEKGIFTGMILIDLQEVFDTIDHLILLKK